MCQMLKPHGMLLMEQQLSGLSTQSEFGGLRLEINVVQTFILYG